MATTVQTLPPRPLPVAWLWDFLKSELAPYPGRIEVVARMVLAATLIMLICMTFRIPQAFQGAIYSLLITRESPRGTLQSSGLIFVFFVLGTIYVLVSVSFFISYPSLHFLWVVASFFLAFYVLRVVNNYAVAATFSVVISVAIPLWDRNVPAETNVEDTLWLLLASVLGIALTVAVELVFVRSKPGDEIVLPLAERLSAVEHLLLSYAQSRRAAPAAVKDLIRLDILGTSRLRRVLGRSDYSFHYRSQMNGAVALIGRLVNIVAAQSQLSFEPTVRDQQQLQDLAAAIARIRASLLNRQIPAQVQFDLDVETARHVPFLREINTVVSLIPMAFVASNSIETYATPDDTASPALMAPDAFANPEHLWFALRGCLAASACYIIYNAIAWPGISTAVTTCFFTALSTIGSSRQKQILRVGGALVGGFLIGMGAQIFILPYLDSIAGFTVLFIAVTALASWILTSSPRLAYFGLQLALAFYLINLQEFRIQTSLAVARDRVVGVLLGLSMMWLVFDQIGGAPGAVKMRKTFISGLRLLAQFAREPLSTDRRVAEARNLSLRETIAGNFDQVRALADGVVFEFGSNRQHDLVQRSEVLRWQPQVRILFINRVALWRYRAKEPGFELPAAIVAAQQDVDNHLAAALDAMAAKLDGKPPHEDTIPATLLEHLDHAVEASISKESDEVLAARLQTFLSLCRKTKSLTAALQGEILMADTGV
ncbi:MAG: FUSC family protein [Acidobacteriaceae bacterium]|nr:FUSC family protein [Acidobacteriaceae bacterium]